VIGVPLPALPYRQRLAALRAHGVGLWDAIVACRRRGSLDGAIRDAEPAEVGRVRRAAPRLALVCFNGKTATRSLAAWSDAGYATLLLPSSSPAYTRPFAEKLAAWQVIGDFLHVAAQARG
jgi:hypoxanthine-DNA glycosylase